VFRNVILLFLVVMSLVIIGVGLSDRAGSCSHQLRLAYVTPPQGPLHEAAQLFVKEVYAKTSGRIDIKIYPSAQLGKGRELVEGLMIGSVDMTIEGGAPIGWYYPEYGAFEAPFAFRDFAHMDRVLNGQAGEIVKNAFLKERGIRILDWWHRGPRYLTTSKKKVEKPEDLEGLKLRVPELRTYIESWRLLGANPTPITLSEAFTSLKLGVVEGQENPLETIYTSSFHEVQKYAMRTEHLLGFYMISISETAYQSLSKADQQILQDCIKQAGKLEHKLMLKYEKQYEDLMKQAGVEFVEVDREAFRQRLVNTLPEVFKDEWASGFYELIINTK